MAKINRSNIGFYIGSSLPLRLYIVLGNPQSFTNFNKVTNIVYNYFWLLQQSLSQALNNPSFLLLRTKQFLAPANQKI